MANPGNEVTKHRTPPMNREITESEAQEIIPEFKELGLNTRELMFAAYYVSNGHNATQAFISAAGDVSLSYSACAVRSINLLKRPEIQKAVMMWFDRWFSERKTALEKEIVETYYLRAFYPIDVFLDADFKPKSLELIDKKWHCCIDGVETKYYGRNAEVEVKVLKLANREKALDQLAKYMGMFAESIAMNITLSDGASERMAKIFKYQQVS